MNKQYISCDVISRCALIIVINRFRFVLFRVEGAKRNFIVA